MQCQNYHYNIFLCLHVSHDLVASNPSILSSLVTCIILSSTLWMYTFGPLTVNSIQSSMHIKTLPPSVVGMCNLSTSIFEWNPPSIVNIFLDFLSFCCNSQFLELLNEDKCLKSDTAQVLVKLNSRYLSLTSLFKFLGCLKCYFDTFSFIISVWSLSSSNIPRYL